MDIQVKNNGQHHPEVIAIRLGDLAQAFKGLPENPPIRLFRIDAKAQRLQGAIDDA